MSPQPASQPAEKRAHAAAPVVTAAAAAAPAAAAAAPPAKEERSRTIVAKQTVTRSPAAAAATTKVATPQTHPIRYTREELLSIRKDTPGLTPVAEEKPEERPSKQNMPLTWQPIEPRPQKKPVHSKLLKTTVIVADDNVESSPVTPVMSESGAVFDTIYSMLDKSNPQALAISESKKPEESVPTPKPEPVLSSPLLSTPKRSTTNNAETPARSSAGTSPKPPPPPLEPLTGEEEEDLELLAKRSIERMSASAGTPRPSPSRHNDAYPEPPTLLPSMPAGLRTPHSVRSTQRTVGGSPVPTYTPVAISPNAVNTPQTLRSSGMISKSPSPVKFNGAAANAGGGAAAHAHVSSPASSLGYNTNSMTPPPNAVKAAGSPYSVTRGAAANGAAATYAQAQPMHARRQQAGLAHHAPAYIPNSAVHPSMYADMHPAALSPGGADVEQHLFAHLQQQQQLRNNSLGYPMSPGEMLQSPGGMSSLDRQAAIAHLQQLQIQQAQLLQGQSDLRRNMLQFQQQSMMGYPRMLGLGMTM
ncbi:hypothetical protein DIPPA_22942 [Diplonema papillatum]|nr:hypothetical protein DIPPA_22942 [Diplonema papillatum]